MKKIFDNCKSIDEYESNNKLLNMYDLYSEDNFYIKYFCKSLEGEMLNWQKDEVKLKRGRNKKYKNCKECGKMIEIKSKKDYSTKYCDDCRSEKIKESKRKWWNNNH